MNREDGELIASAIQEKTGYQTHAWLHPTGEYVVCVYSPREPDLLITDETLTIAAILHDAGLIGANDEVAQ